MKEKLRGREMDSEEDQREIRTPRQPGTGTQNKTMVEKGGFPHRMPALCEVALPFD